MSFHELCAGYPWLTKRVARVLDKGTRLPRRNPFAYFIAAVVPYAGRLGAGFGALMMVYVVGVLAAVALPAYQTYTVKAKVSQAILSADPALKALAQYYEAHHQVPSSLEEAGIPERLGDGTGLSVDTKSMSLVIESTWHSTPACLKISTAKSYHEQRPPPAMWCSPWSSPSSSRTSPAARCPV